MLYFSRRWFQRLISKITLWFRIYEEFMKKTKMTIDDLYNVEFMNVCSYLKG